jgi:lipid A 4'-phosphatase
MHTQQTPATFSLARRSLAPPAASDEGHARRILAVLLGTVALIAVTFALNPQWDLALSRPFYDPTSKQFPLTFNATISWLRDQAVLLTIACLACLLGSIVLKLILPARRMLIPGRAIIFLALSFALGPGLLVNGILKEQWSRPRPAEVVAFGGDKTFMPWWDPRGACDQNCSFVSGETSTAAWTFAPAILIPGPLGTVAIGAAAVYTLGMATMRLIVGGHFFTDLAFAVLFTALLIWAMHALIYRWPRTALDENRIDAAIGRFGLFLRHDLLATLAHYGLATFHWLRGCTSALQSRLRRVLPSSSEDAALRRLGMERDLLDRVQDLREAYLGAPITRIVAEALEAFIAERLLTEPEVKRRYEEARRRRLGLASATVRLVPTSESQPSEKDRATGQSEAPPAAMQ